MKFIQRVLIYCKKLCVMVPNQKESAAIKLRYQTTLITDREEIFKLYNFAVPSCPGGRLSKPAGHSTTPGLHYGVYLMSLQRPLLLFYHSCIENHYSLQTIFQNLFLFIFLHALIELFVAPHGFFIIFFTFIFIFLFLSPFKNCTSQYLFCFSTKTILS